MSSSNHTMASLNLLSKNFIKTLLTEVDENRPEVKYEPKRKSSVDPTQRKPRLSLFSTVNDVDDDDDDENDNSDENIKEKHQKWKNIEKALQENVEKRNPIDLEKKLSQLNIGAAKTFQL